VTPVTVDPAAGAEIETLGATVSGCTTVKLTVTSFGEPPAPAALIVTVPLYVPALRPALVAVTNTLPAPAPLRGVAPSHGASVNTDQESSPPPLFEMATFWPLGDAPPSSAEKTRLAGATESTGPSTDDENAEAGPSLYRAPVDQVEGSVATFTWAGVSAGAPPPQQRSRNRRVPPVPRSAIQYGEPAERETADESGTTFHATAPGAASVPWASSVPGWPVALSVYTPTVRDVAVEPVSTYTETVAA
jgi:hypothetical protein